MPQEFHVLSCVTCKAFQVQIVKKSSNKWNCKVCNTKQSVLQVYCRGPSAECRQVVQQLNLARGEAQLRENYKTLAEIAQEEQHAAENNTRRLEIEVGSGEEVGIENKSKNYSHSHVGSSEEESSGFQSSKPTASSLVKHPSGVVSVAQEKSLWKIFLESEDD